MKRTWIILIVSCLMASCEEKTSAASNEDLPNIVLFLVDDLGWTDLGCYGSTFYQTPNADALAKQGIRFTDAYAASPVCSPTRASIMTGKYPATLNCTDWITGHKKPYAEYQVPDWKMYLDPAEVTLAEALKGRGYQTVHMGKWHLGENEKDWPEFHGFDQNIGGWKKGSPVLRDKKGGYFTPYSNPRLADGPPGEYLTERLAREAAKYIETHNSRPFFLNFWLYNVHTPLQAKAEKVLKYKERVDEQELQSNPTYAAMVEHMDEALGVIVDKLKAEGIYENTIIIFASDNGGLIGNRGNTSKKPRVTSNKPLRSGKGDRYEGGVRTPLMVSWPGKIKPGVTHVPAISADIFPTVLGLLPSIKEQGVLVDGQNLAPLLTEGRTPDREALYWHYPHYHTEGARPYSAIRKEGWKLIHVFGEEHPELYDLTNDIGEKNDLIEQYPEIGRELLGQLNEWKSKVNAQDPVPNPEFNPEKKDLWK